MICKNLQTSNILTLYLSANFFDRVSADDQGLIFYEFHAERLLNNV